VNTAVATVEVASVDVLYVVTGRPMPQTFLVLNSRVTRVHLRLLGHVQTVQVRVLYSLNL